ncbi:MAG: hypothetical protein A2487_17390 [Candidatus Raymondbacteria bacterium RifOxyC12_full_50_8]|uniref:Uncharacterized protein n=1 Tax=Candidatus Raymondbacteria bacterium RIFOXYD12_FULL_49_13 TaxID=1817890 RepID=A0A1F7EZN4_UNCRA|nr:MAG: hypothetical protein A2350_02380 [Candidatus Raymondbacteria bacterium RifOxyB12_full_50_8]OGJ94226.1 MAG: hypothetical protein A2487_17390 [Candidatus Raymondbacteria bacterium RifOxyC12_full_50_8]OGJ94474.1 MAG: hypothetical protein A2248_15505 [Candidatus Raymondbacteria bacterium RIFOXYA2_FULL_49_16]OGJ99762.1 MAG: hypothetical protein A2519_12505 [Candidatus Raymondbacteria bacterium RIFOXYD12_FULL_49_13]OGP45303.1 MAG: hypothetical protein A2324_12570 [Candidatus Raymondbacteria b
MNETDPFFGLYDQIRGAAISNPGTNAPCSRPLDTSRTGKSKYLSIFFSTFFTAIFPDEEKSAG